MAFSDAPDYQRAFVRAQQALSTVAGGTATVSVNLPDNAESVVVVTPGGSPGGTLKVQGNTTGIEYTGLPAATDASVTASPAWYFNVATAIDAAVTVTFSSAPGASWYVFANVVAAVFPIAGASSGPPPAGGNVTLHTLPFAYNSSSILTGYSIFTPTVGQVLLDAWIQVNTHWNGTTPKADIGISGGTLPGGIGWFSEVTQIMTAATSDGAIDMTFADSTIGGGNHSIQSGHYTLKDAAAMANVFQFLEVASGTTPQSVTWIDPSTITSADNEFAKYVPFPFLSTQPVIVWVSQDGTNTGASPSSTQGAADLYLLTSP